MSHSRADGALYEVTVHGALGPVLRTAFAPCWSSESEAVTIVHVRARDDEDLVDLVQMLGDRGLEVANLFVRP